MMLRYGVFLLTCAVGLGCPTGADEGHKKGHGEHEEAHKEGHEGHGGHEAGHDEGEAGHEAGHEGHGGHDDAEEGAVHLSVAAFARAGLRLASVTRGQLEGRIHVPAEVQFNPEKVAHVSPLVPGQLVSVDVAVGDTVTDQQALAVLRSVALGQARADLSRARALRDVAGKTLRRQKQLRKAGISAERSLLAARSAFDEATAEREAALSRLSVFGADEGTSPDMPLRSPIGGEVIARHATRGENVAPENNLFVVADLSEVWVMGRVYERDIAQIKKGMVATLSLAAYPSRIWTGEVDYVAAALNVETRTLPIRVALKNPDGALRPGSFGTLSLSQGAGESGQILVPITAVQTLEGRPVVFVPGEEPREFEARPVTLGQEAAGQVEVLVGLDDGARVVVEGAFVLKSELMRGELGEGHAH